MALQTQLPLEDGMDLKHPHLVRVGGVACWRYADGRMLPLLAGGDDGDDDDAGKGGKGGKDDTDDDAGKGGDGDAAKARREAAELRRRLKATEAERDQLKAAQQTDAERLAARAEAAEGTATKATEKLRVANLRLAVLSEASGLGIVDPKLAVRLVDAGKVEYDDDGEPDKATVIQQLKDLVEEHPNLTRTGDADNGRKGSAAEGDGKAKVNAFLRGEAGL
jgi:hypothetical protein